MNQKQIGLGILITSIAIMLIYRAWRPDVEYRIAETTTDHTNSTPKTATKVVVVPVTDNVLERINLNAKIENPDAKAADAGEILAKLFESDTEEAGKFLQSIGTGRMRYKTIVNMLDNSSVSSLEVIRIALENSGYFEDLSTFKAWILRAKQKVGISTLVNITNSTNDTDLKNVTGQAIGELKIDIDPSTLLLESDSTSYQNSVLKGYTREKHNLTPRDVKILVERYPGSARSIMDGAFTTIVREKGPEVAKTYLNQGASDDVNKYGYELLAWNWSLSNSLEASKWVAELSPGIFKDNAIKGMIQVLMNSDRASALEWSGTILDSSIKTEVDNLLVPNLKK